MAKQSSVNKNNRRKKLVAQYAARRKKLKAVAGDLNKPAEERFAARLKLAQLPRNSSATRVRNRCELTGRSRGYYRKLKVCRNMLRELASQGMIPGMVKSSW
jgi:small subunit ribosomal protein S14